MPPALHAEMQVPSPRGRTWGHHLSGHCQGCWLGWWKAGLEGGLLAAGAQRCWEAVAKRRGDPPCWCRAAADPVHSPWVHVCTGTCLYGYSPPHIPTPLLAHPCKALGRDRYSAALLIPFYSLSTLGPPVTAVPTPSLRPSHPKHIPQPPGGHGHLPRGSPPQRGSPRGSLQQHPSQGDAQRGAGERLQLWLPVQPLHLARVLGGNHRPYLVTAT